MPKCPRCPRCEDKNLVAFNHENVDFDFCADGCLGIWCDSGELAFYNEISSDFPFIMPSYEANNQTSLKCPKCVDSFLHENAFHEKEATLIDSCSKCSGVWLDKFELAQIANLTAVIDANSRILAVVNHYKKKGYSIF